MKEYRHLSFPDHEAFLAHHKKRAEKDKDEKSKDVLDTASRLEQAALYRRTAELQAAGPE